jgi:hypothetical protein
MKLAAIALAALVALSGTNALARDKPVKHCSVITRRDARPNQTDEQRTPPSYATPMPAR